MTGPRSDLATRLDAAAAANVTVFAEEPAYPPALPALLVRPGSPYRELSAAQPDCIERWRLEVVAVVPIDTLTPLDDLITVTRDVVRAMPYATWLGVRSAPAVLSIGGKSMHGALADCYVEV